MSQQEYYETVMREQEFLQSRLRDYKLHKEYLESELSNVTHALDEIQGLIVKLEKELGDVSDS
jgi:hypothetical protein